MPAPAHIGGVHLRVGNLSGAKEFYTTIVGMEEVPGEGGTLRARGGHDATVRLTESPDAPARGRRRAGLFHVAFRYPGRRELASALLRLIRTGYPIGGAADHRVSEAVYLEDPDGNGVELYCDRPRESWPWKGNEIEMTTEPLDLEALLEAARGETSAGSSGAGPEIGHVHLQVTDLARAGTFYHDVLGFSITQRSYPGALFLSAGGYHHHIGLNTWNTRGGSPADVSQRGLLSFSLRTGDPAAVRHLASRLGLPAADPLVVRDPDHITIEILP